MIAIVIELRSAGEMWQALYQGQVIACALSRQEAINATAGLLRRQLLDPVTRQSLQFVGLDLVELLSAPPKDPSGRRKGLPIDLKLYEQAEAYLQTELVSAEEAALIDEYRRALEARNFGRALECLVELGEWQECTNPFWQLLERLAPAVWPTQNLVDRRLKGQREAWIAAIRQRAH